MRRKRPVGALFGNKEESESILVTLITICLIAYIRRNATSIAC